MSRFSPTQKSSARPGGIGGLAAALQEGVTGFQGQRDRQEGQRNRAFAQDVQRGGLLERGISIDTPSEPEGFGSAFARALSGAPAPQPARPPVPGAFMVDAGDFEKVDPKTGLPAMPVMQSGNVSFDPNVPLQREMASATAKGELGLLLAQKGRRQRQGELTTALGTVKGAPLGAATSESAAADWLGRPPERGLRIGDPGYADAMAEVAAARQGVSQGGMTVGERNKVVQIEDLQNLINRAQAAQVGPDGKLVKSGRIGGIIPLPNWARLQFDVGGRPSRQLQLLVSDLTSQVGNLRSGGAITPQEFERLEGFLPTMNERPEIIQDKLQSFEDTLNDMMATRRSRGSIPTPTRRLDDIQPDDLVNEFEAMFGRKP